MGSETMLTLKVVILTCWSRLKCRVVELSLRNSGELVKSLLLMGSNLRFLVDLERHEFLARV